MESFNELSFRQIKVKNLTGVTWDAISTFNWGKEFGDLVIGNREWSFIRKVVVAVSIKRDGFWKKILSVEIQWWLYVQGINVVRSKSVIELVSEVIMHSLLRLWKNKSVPFGHDCCCDARQFDPVFKEDMQWNLNFLELPMVESWRSWAIFWIGKK